MLQSRNYAPPDDLEPYIRRFYVFDAALPDSFEIKDSLLAENAFVRVLIHGDWAWEDQPGHWQPESGALLFGSNSMPLMVHVRGSFLVAGFAIRPSAWRSLFRQPAADYVNLLSPLSHAWSNEAEIMTSALQVAQDDQARVDAMVASIRRQLARIGRRKIDAAVQTFERIARLDSMIRIEEAARQIGLSVRQLERRCMDSYGLTPKAILRRSRFLDMAEAMRGFSTPKEEELAQLRYFDQSHLNREFHRFAGMTPGKFRKATTPLLTAGLKLRVEGKDIL